MNCSQSNGSSGSNARKNRYTQIRAVKKSPKIDAALKKIENDIAALQSTLPPRLQLETEHESRTDLRRIALWLRRQHRNDGGLRLNGLTGGQYPTERDPHTL